jgi:cation transport ATPase
MSKIQKEQELEALLKSSRDRVEAKESIQSSFNAFNDFINVADKKLNDKLDKLGSVVDTMQLKQNRAIQNLHKETINESLKQQFVDDINKQHKELKSSLEKANQALRDNNKRIEMRYKDLYKEDVVSVAMRSIHGLIYIFYLIVCVGSLVGFNAIDNAINHKTLSLWTMMCQMATYAVIAIIPLASWLIHIRTIEHSDYSVQGSLGIGSLCGFVIGLIVFFIYFYFFVMSN